MLVLSRCPGQKICIGDDIEIVIVKVSGDRVRVGIIAPDRVAVHREEIKLAIEALQKSQEINGVEEHE